jgi:anti-sigma B factor antagonist
VQEDLRQPVVAAVEQQGKATIVRLAGELDLYNADEARDALADASEQDPERIVIDLSEISFVDSTGLGVLVAARSKLKNRRALLLAAPKPETRRALEISGLDRFLAVHETVEEALAAPV